MLNIVMALDAEAEPIIRHFDLVPGDGGDRFKTFRSDKIDFNLVVSGVGRDLSATASAFLAEKSSAAPGTVWLNMGIGGQRDLSLGTPVLADRITDDETESTWYPPILFKPGCKTAPVRTVAHPVNDYPTGDVYDMEASGFYAAASQVSSPGMIHVLKVISDNSPNGTENITRNEVIRLIGDHLGEIERIVSSLAGFTGK